MYDYLLQDWTTISVDASQTALVQAEADWISFQPYQDIIFWLEVRAVVTGGATNIQMSYQTAPARDESLFKDCVSAFNLSPSSTPQVDKLLLSQNPTVPLARWVRWRIAPDGGTVTTDWGATFRIHCVANAVGLL